MTRDDAEGYTKLHSVTTLKKYGVCLHTRSVAILLVEVAEWRWLEQAIDLGDCKQVKLMALDDPEFEPLWLDIAEI